MANLRPIETMEEWQALYNACRYRIKKQTERRKMERMGLRYSSRSLDDLENEEPLQKLRKERGWTWGEMFSYRDMPLSKFPPKPK